jgi:hypothetical protein
MSKTTYYNIDYEGLKKYLLNLTQNDFFIETKMPDGKFVTTYPNEKIRKAIPITVIESGLIDGSKISFADVIFYGIPFLASFYGTDICVAELSEKKHLIPNDIEPFRNEYDEEYLLSHKTNAKFVRMVLPRSNMNYRSFPMSDKSAKKNFWFIPEQFIRSHSF